MTKGTVAVRSAVCAGAQVSMDVLADRLIPASSSLSSRSPVLHLSILSHLGLPLPWRAFLYCLVLVGVSSVRFTHGPPRPLLHHSLLFSSSDS